MRARPGKPRRPLPRHIRAPAQAVPPSEFPAHSARHKRQSVRALTLKDLPEGLWKTWGAPVPWRESRTSLVYRSAKSKKESSGPIAVIIARKQFTWRSASLCEVVDHHAGLGSYVRL